ncbi:MAG: helix-turn-helix transcriptional regulator, partial [Cyclobacteriaceae bacterium]
AHPSQNLNIEFEEDFFNDGVSFSCLRIDEKSNIEFLRIYFELLLNDVCSKQSIEQIVKSLLWNDEYDSNGSWIQKLTDLLNDRWDEFPSLEDLSDELGIHPVTISKYFSKKTGATLSEYMRKIKVKRAVDLLINTPDSFAKIALSCGFSDQSHMTRLVKKYTRLTPGIIRTLR